MKSQSNYHTIKKFQQMVQEEYNTNINEENYIESILKEVEKNTSLHNYFKQYIEENKDKLDVLWALEMFLFIRASEKKDVEAVENYSKRLKIYADNYYTEYVLADMGLRYYGNIFESKERFLKSLELKKNDSMSYYNLGYIYNLLGMFDKSLENYQKSSFFSDEAPNGEELKVKALYNMAKHYLIVKNDDEKSEIVLNEVLAINPDYSNARQMLASLKGE
ncbi:tetratricopeptide (TPR) repeat protein [Clostridium pascui]|uniref:tetratricopeptide repeat protein n=1 Tax=Clostridium pascui TaxID=46609 RepID=UPI0019579327|nr:tetratricopeptide repeat protein [Clostridium pascui]MBM7871052.1 tetratricopeptide (TPR) repeat protein [Clostridium pascui]